MLSVSNAAALGCASLLLLGCSSTQLNYNALDIASTVDDVLTQQVVDIIGRFIIDPSINPAQVSISSGSVTTTNQASIAANNPLNKAITSTAQLSTAAGAAIPAITNINSGVSAASTIAPSLNNQASQNLSLTMNTDSDQERRLRALYRYAIRHIDAQRLCSEYPLLSTQTSLAPEETPNDGLITKTAMDAQFLREPGCVICSDQANSKNINSLPHSNYCRTIKGRPASGLYVNPRLRNGWLVSQSDGSYSDDANRFAYIGRYANGQLYTKDREDFRQFVLFVLEATNLGSSAGQSGKAGPVKLQGVAAPAGAQLLLQ